MNYPLEIEKAIEFRELGRFNEAENILTKWIGLNPNDAYSYALLSHVLTLSNKDDKAWEAVKTAHQIEPTLPIVSRCLARLLLKNKRVNEAENYAKKALKDEPNNPENHVILAAILATVELNQQAIVLINQAIILNPDYAEAYAQLAILNYKLKNDTEALNASEKALSIKPHLWQLWGMVGTLRFKINDLVNADKAYTKALLYDEKNIDYMISLSEIKRKQNLLDDGLEILNKVINISPKNLSAMLNIGLILQEQKKFKEAKTVLNNALKIEPENIDVLINLGNIYIENLDFKTAREYLEFALEKSPRSALALNSLGRVLQELNKGDEALVKFISAVEIDPKMATAYNNIGNILREQKKYTESISNFNKSISIKPNVAEFHNNKGLVYKEIGQLKDALECFYTAIKINENYADAYNNLGTLLREMNYIKESESSFYRALSIKPDYAEVYSNLAGTLKKDNRFIEALTSVGRALSLKDNLSAALQIKAAMYAYLSDYQDVIKYSNQAITMKSSELSYWGPRLYFFIYHPDLSAQEICEEHIKWGDLQPKVEHAGFEGHDRTLARKLRVGYVSPDFRSHTCRFYFEPLFANFDHTRIELFAYSNVLHGDEHTLRFKEYFDKWRDIRGVSDADAAQMIRQDGIDILVDGCGHMADTRLGVFVHKPAPIQVTWLGSAWTTGLKQMDYAVFDPHMAPEGTATSEQIVRLPRTWAAFRPGEKARKATLTPLPALHKGHITFGYSGRTERLNYKVFNTWGRILRRLPSARLVLDYKVFSDPLTYEYYQKFLAQHDIDTSRVLMRNSENIFEGLGDIDILLDSFPHSGGTMLFDAVWMGVPALTLASPRPVGRIGTSLMTNLGLPEWVAKDEQEYEDKAVAFAQDIPALASLRSGMRPRMQASSVMDEKGFARDMEDAFETMWQRWCRGQ